MRIRVFGPPWPAPICDDAPRVDTPVGADCMWCGEPIVDGDSGIDTPVIGLGHAIHHRAAHHDCWLRGIIGSVGHQLGKCSCHPARRATGAAYDDPPGLTKREAAKLAVALFQYRGGPRDV